MKQFILLAGLLLGATLLAGCGDKVVYVPYPVQQQVQQPYQYGGMYSQAPRPYYRPRVGYNPSPYVPLLMQRCVRQCAHRYRISVAEALAICRGQAVPTHRGARYGTSRRRIHAYDSNMRQGPRYYQRRERPQRVPRLYLNTGRGYRPWP